MRFSIFKAGFLLLTLFACKKEPDCTGVMPTYTADIKSIMDSNCATAGCHAGNTPADNIDLSTYIGTVGADDLLDAIEHKSGISAMPKGKPKLDDATIKLVSCWIKNGRPE